MQVTRDPGSQSKAILVVLMAGLSPVGVLIGAILFGFSLTPSMVLRSPEIQSALGGAVFAIGYLFWYLVRSVLEWLGLRGQLSRRAGMLFFALAAVMVLLSLWQDDSWQNSIATHGT